MTLFFELHSVFEGFPNSLRHLIVAVCIRIKGNRVYQRHVKMIVNYDALVSCDIYDFTDHSATIVATIRTGMGKMPSVTFRFFLIIITSFPKIDKADVCTYNYNW